MVAFVKRDGNIIDFKFPFSVCMLMSVVPTLNLPVDVNDFDSRNIYYNRKFLMTIFFLYFVIRAFPWHLFTQAQNIHKTRKTRSFISREGALSYHSIQSTKKKIENSLFFLISFYVFYFGVYFHIWFIHQNAR